MFRYNFIVASSEYLLQIDTHYYGYPFSFATIEWQDKTKDNKKKTFHVKFTYQHGRRVYFCKKELSKNLKKILKRKFDVTEG